MVQISISADLLDPVMYSFGTIEGGIRPVVIPQTSFSNLSAPETLEDVSIPLAGFNFNSITSIATQEDTYDSARYFSYN